MSSNFTDSSVAQAIEAELEYLLDQFVRDYRITRAMWIVSLVLLLYDWSLTFADEVKYMWRGRFKWTRPLYWFNRYWPIANLAFDNVVLAVAHNTDSKFCKFWVNFLVYAQSPYEATIVAIYVLRIYALYGCNRRVLFLLCVIYVGVFTSENVIIGIVIRDAVFDPLPLPTFTGCLPSNIKPYAWTFWMPMLIFETILLAMSIFRSVVLAANDWQTRRLVFVLLRDSVVYFGGVILAILANVVGWKLGGDTLFAAFLPLAITSFSILGCRLLLNIQAAADPTYRVDYLSSTGPSDTVGMNTNTYPLQSMEFQSGPDSDTEENTNV